MAAVSTTWVNPAGAVLDKSTGAVIDETMTDAWSSDLYHLGGTAGYIAGRAHNASTQSIADSSSTALALGAEDNDADPNGLMHDNVTNNSRITARTAGYYHIGAWVQFATNSTGYRHVTLRLNGATALAQDIRAAVSGTNTECSLYIAYPLAVSDYLEVVVIQNSGGALNMTAAHLSVCKA